MASVYEDLIDELRSKLKKKNIDFNIEDNNQLEIKNISPVNTINNNIYNLDLNLKKNDTSKENSNNNLISAEDEEERIATMRRKKNKKL